MLTLASCKKIDLSSSRCGCTQTSAGPKEDEFGDVPKVEPNAAPVWTTVLADFVPDDVGLVCKAPPLHDLKTL